MAILTINQAMTLAEAMKREGFDDAAAVIGEAGQNNEFVDECPWYPSSHGLYHKYSKASRLGVGAFGRPNTAVPGISSGTEELTEPVKLYEADSTIDERVLNGVLNAYKVRDSEDALNLEGIMQDWIYQLIYNNEASTPDGFKGLTYRRGSIVANRTWNAGGTGSDLTSLWVFEFSKRGFYLTYDSGAGAPGVKNEDRGRHKVNIPVGTGQMWAWIRHYEIWAAIVLRDERAMQRFANFDTTSGTKTFDETAAQTFLKLKNQLPSVGRNAVAFCNRDLKGQVDAQAYAKTNAVLSLRDIQNYGPITFIGDIPVRMLEALLSAETIVA